METVKYLYEQRRRCLVWGAAAAESADQLLKLAGWDPLSPAFHVDKDVDKGKDNDKDIDVDTNSKFCAVVSCSAHCVLTVKVQNFI